MYKIGVILFFLFITFFRLNAQILPLENSKLNYRLIGFSFPEGKTGYNYKIEIATGNFNSEDSFKKNICLSFSSDKNKIIGEVPSFGMQYTWRTVFTNANLMITKSSLHHFSTAIIPDVDTNIKRLRITMYANAYKDAFVFLDATRALYDMNGNPVWFLPITDGMVTDYFPSFGDIKATGKGTITFLANRKAGHIYEVDYNGTILWKGPNTGQVSGDTSEYYNHEFTRLSNGHYMVLGGEYVSLKLPATVDSSFLNDFRNKGKIIWDAKTNTFYERMEFGTLIEYDQSGNIAWYWKSSGYFKGADVYNHTNKMGVFDIDDVHENAFYFDEKDSVIYVSFKGVSRIIKVKYPEGNILKVYGRLYDPGAPGYDNNLFYHQHSCRLSQEGYLYLYNNNDRHTGSVPTLIMMKEPVSQNDTLTKVWEYQCTTEGIDTTLKEAPEFAGLGSVIELPDRSMLACLSDDEYTKVFIVNRDKKILWSALPERWDATNHKWHAILEYRASMIMSRKALEQLIWNAEIKESHN